MKGAAAAVGRQMRRWRILIALLIPACTPMGSDRAPAVTAHPNLGYEDLATGGIGIGPACSRAAADGRTLRNALALELADYSDLPVAPPDAIATALGEPRVGEIEATLCREPPPTEADLKAMLGAESLRYLILVRIEREEVKQRYNEYTGTEASGYDTKVYTTERIVVASLQVYDHRLGETVWASQTETSVDVANVVSSPKPEGAFFGQLAQSILFGLAEGALGGTYPEPPSSACALSKSLRELVESLPRRDPPDWSDQVAAAFATPVRCDESQRWRQGKFFWE